MHPSKILLHSYFCKDTIIRGKTFLIQQIVFRDLISTTFHITWRIITSGILTSSLCYSFARIVPLLRSITCLSQGFVLFRLFSVEKPDEIHSDIFSVKNRTTSIPTSCELVLINMVIGFYINKCIYVRISQHLLLAFVFIIKCKTVHSDILKEYQTNKINSNTVQNQVNILRGHCLHCVCVCVLYFHFLRIQFWEAGRYQNTCCGK